MKIARLKYGALSWLFAIGVFCASDANALGSSDVLRLSNEVRARGCGGHAGVKSPLTMRTALSVAARQVQRADKLRDTLARVDYRAEHSAVFHIGGRLDAKTLERALRDNYCSLVTDRGLTDIGAYLSDRDLWVILARPFAPPASGDANKVAARVLQLVNEARAKPRRCGSQKFSAVPPLELDATLMRAAFAHANDMAKHGFVEHDGSDGSAPSDRATRAGYRWKSIGENVAGGQTTADEVVGGWLESPHHCENIMDKDFIHMGIAYIVNAHKGVGIYWAQEFGTPR